jgi:hypothetical protein
MRAPCHPLGHPLGRPIGGCLFVLASWLLGCAPNVGGGSGTGGESGVSGGSTGSGGSQTGTGGSTSTGGAAATGGATGTGGSSTTATGGVSGTGGTAATGGASGHGGTGGTGTTGTGGAHATGGAPGTGGTTGIAGTSGSGSGGSGTTTGSIDLTGRKALLVVDSPSSMSDGETIVEEVLQERGLVVTVGASTGPASLAAGQSLVVVSDTAGAGDFVPIFGSVAVPMIVFGNSAFQTLGWTASSSAKGTVASTTNVSVVNVTTPLSSDLTAGLGFPMILSTTSTSLYWGTPGGAPLTIASIMGSPTELIDFAYEKGSAMATGTAPARRVGLGWKTSAVQNLTINGFKLFSAAVDWTAGSN